MLAVRRDEPGLMLRYWNRPDEEREAFRGDWFVSGDLVEFDADGYVWHHGRADEVMNALGYRVSPAEVEKCLFGAPLVADAAVAERPGRDDQTIIKAYVVLRDGAVPDADMLRRIARRISPPISVRARSSSSMLCRAMQRQAYSLGLAIKAQLNSSAPLSRPDTRAAFRARALFALG